MEQLSLFPEDPAGKPKPAGAIIADTNIERRINQGHSIDSYYDPDTQLKRNGQSYKLYCALKKLLSANDRELSEYTGIPLSVVPDRRGRLLKMGLIEYAYEGVDPVTNKTVSYYRVRK